MPQHTDIIETTMIGYECFENNDDFYNWQLKYPEYSITNIQPLQLSKLASDCNLNCEKLNINSVNCSIFVIYTYKQNVKIKELKE